MKNDAPDVLDDIARILCRIEGPGSFAVRCTAPPESLAIEVEGVGPLALPVSEGQALELCAAGRPARYGRGEETLLDRSVRDTWEIPGERLRIDQERWDPTLGTALDHLRAGLGLDPSRHLVPELHNLLVYGPGQFFLPHRDSEKSDDMIATLVVTLPSVFEGGVFEVEHGGETLRFRGSGHELSFVAFYPDCRHQVRPVKSGHRLVLTYNLSLAEDSAGDGGTGAESARSIDTDVVEELAGRLGAHFETPRPPRWAWRKDAPDREPPSRLVYLLDHHYSRRGLAWDRLKGHDGPRVRVLRAAGAKADCEAVLAVAEIHETWGCYEEGWDEPWGRHRRWTREEEGWVEEGGSPATGPDGYELQELHDSSIALTHWLEEGDGAALQRVHTLVDDDEVCHATPTVELEPYASEYEGYMGNWGNTMDRWYRRAAVVLWSRERAFRVRAEAAPRQALDELVRRLRRGEVDEVRARVRTMLPDWTGTVAGEAGRKLLGRALRVAEGLDEPELAEALLEPFRLEALTPRGARAFAALVRRYGEPWTDALLARWSASERGRFAGDPDPMDWIAGLPSLGHALIEADPQAGWSAACLVLWDRWEWLAERIDRAGAVQRPAYRREAVERLTAPILGLLEGAALAGDRDLTERMLAFVCSDEREFLLPCLVGVLRAAHTGERTADPPAAGLDRLRARTTSWLRRRLSSPARAPDDWSVELPAGCDCELCTRLATFLEEADARRLEWPIAKAKRKHIHRRIDDAELPVHHETRRTGSPYTLVLTKTDALFEREAAERRSLQDDLEWLDGLG